MINSKPLKLQQMAVFDLLDSPKLISRKIRVAEKFCNFHTVQSKLRKDTYLTKNCVKSTILLKS